MKPARALAALALGAGRNTSPPQRDAFIPPYAEKACWMRLYEQEGFGGPACQLEGPAFVETLSGVPVARFSFVR